jgi:deoxyribose-phosphate aldolase
MTDSYDYVGVDLPGCIESTLLSHEASEVDIDELCTAAIWFRLAGVCVYPEYVSYAAELLKNVSTKVVTVVNFPGGDMPIDEVLAQIDTAIAQGADEIDYVMNLPAALSNDWGSVAADIALVSTKVHENDRVLKLILETCLLNDSQISKACQLAVEYDVDYVKTSTGFSTGGATVAVVRLMRQVVGKNMGIKASGGIKTSEDALALIAVGANRLGTSNALKVIGATRD